MSTPTIGFARLPKAVRELLSAYDVATVAQEVAAAGLPTEYADKLLAAA